MGQLYVEITARMRRNHRKCHRYLIAARYSVSKVLGDIVSRLFDVLKQGPKMRCAHDWLLTEGHMRRNNQRRNMMNMTKSEIVRTISVDIGFRLDIVKYGVVAACVV